MKTLKPLVLTALLVVSLAPLFAQVTGRDPLTEQESDDLREAAQEPEKRLKLYLKYTHARLDAIDQLRGDPKLASGRGKQVHDLLEDFTKLMDEMDDNIDDYADRHEDLRKPLKDVIQANSEYQVKLRTLKEQGPPPGAKADEASEYSFVLQNAVEAVNTSLDDARKLLEEQEQYFKQKKEEEKKKKK